MEKRSDLSVQLDSGSNLAQNGSMNSFTTRLRLRPQRQGLLALTVHSRPETRQTRVDEFRTYVLWYSTD